MESQLRRVAISQPEHFPYLGYFQKMLAADLFILLDDVRFSGPRSFQNRNRYKSFRGLDEWLTVPVAAGAYSLRIDEVKTAADLAWRPKLLRKLKYRFGEDFGHVYAPERLVDINLRSINVIRSAMRITTPMIRSSELACTGSKTARLSALCRSVGADVYVCGRGGAAYLYPGEMEGVTVEYFHEQVPDYQTALSHITREALRHGLAQLARGDSKA